MTGIQRIINLSSSFLACFHEQMLRDKQITNKTIVKHNLSDSYTFPDTEHIEHITNHPKNTARKRIDFFFGTCNLMPFLNTADNMNRNR